MKNETEHLRWGWLGNLDRSLSTLILDKGRLVRAKNNTTLYSLGQPQDCLYGIVGGAIKMLVTMNEQYPRFGHIAGPGFWFGETEAVTGQVGIMDMMAVGDTTLLCVSRDVIDEIAAVHPGMWPALTLLAIQNQGLAIGAADDLMIRDTSKRLAAVLLRLSSRRNAMQGVSPLNHIPINWNDLSEAANLARSTVAEKLSEFSHRGLIRKRRRMIEILDANGLENVLTEPAQ
ncbi:Crp/Fnr family transcriptional regulator [Ruegeria arenilitoris]|uniref:Crp/Fnr family transcriptional regulator n=1 Tax=Ruegeria arenilitoris TaxID=1173585 RepID=UPI00147C1705|nr:Crp/Fnr family transcriptional regulator [Ruegeria arenilitoris]